MGRYAGDVCFISAYAPVHEQRAQTPASEALRIEFSRKLDGVIRQVPNRCRVILCMDANGEVDTALPWIGSAGSRIRDGRKKWNQNGHGLLELLRSDQLVATSTHGEANRQCWTWLSPFGTRHRLDYMIARQTDADHGKVRVDYRMPVGLSGFRDHRPLIKRVCTRAQEKEKQSEEEKPKRWDRTLVEREYRLLLNWERAAQKGQDAPSTEEPMFLRLRNMTTPDIGAEIVKRTLNTCCTVQKTQNTNTSTSSRSLSTC